MVQGSTNIVNVSCVLLDTAPFLKHYNDLELQNIVLILDEYHRNNNDTLCSNCPFDIISSLNNTFTAQEVSTNTITVDRLTHLMKNELPSIIVLPNTFFVKNEMGKHLKNQNHNALSSTCWVISYTV